MDQHSMPNEIPVDITEPGSRAYVEVGVQEGDDYTDMTVESLDGSVSVRLSITDLDLLIETLMDARAIASLNT